MPDVGYPISDITINNDGSVSGPATATGLAIVEHLSQETTGLAPINVPGGSVWISLGDEVTFDCTMGFALLVYSALCVIVNAGTATLTAAIFIDGVQMDGPWAPVAAGVAQASMSATGTSRLFYCASNPHVDMPMPVPPVPTGPNDANNPPAAFYALKFIAATSGMVNQSSLWIPGMGLPVPLQIGPGPHTLEVKYKCALNNNTTGCRVQDRRTHVLYA